MSLIRTGRFYQKCRNVKLFLSAKRNSVPFTPWLSHSLRLSFALWGAEGTLKLHFGSLQLEPRLLRSPSHALQLHRVIGRCQYRVTPNYPAAGPHQFSPNNFPFSRFSSHSQEPNRNTSFDNKYWNQQKPPTSSSPFPSTWFPGNM